MVKLVSKGFLLIAISLLIINLFFCKLFVSPFWGNKQVLGKNTYILNHDIDPDTYFIGSSNTFRHIDPIIFNRLTNNETNGFNLGSDGCYPLQLEYNFDEILKQDKSIKNIFVEFNSFDHYGSNRYKATKSLYYLDILDAIPYTASLIESKKSFRKKLLLGIKYYNSIFRNIFKIGIRKDFLSYLYNEKAYHFGYKLLGKGRKGFLALNGIMSPNIEASRLNRVVKSSRKKILKAYENAENSTESISLYNWAYGLISKGEDKGINVFFMLPPKEFVLNTHEEIIKTFNNLPENNRIDLMNPFENGEFYKVKFRWDGGHLNGLGAKLYTKALATAFLEKTK